MFLDFYKSLKVKLIERFKNRKEGLGKVTKDVALIFGSLTVLGGIANFAATNVKKKEIRDRANGKCEACKEKFDQKDAIVGHLDHSKGDRYQVKNNLRLHCPACEAEWHTSHVNSAKDIGLSEENNLRSVISSLLNLLKWSEEKFVNLCCEYQNLEDVFARIYLKEPELVTKAFESQEVDFPIDLVAAFELIASDSEIVFMNLYLSNKDFFDSFYEKNGANFPVDLDSFFQDFKVNFEKDFVHFYLTYQDEIDNFFRQFGDDSSLNIEQFLTQLSTDDPEYFSKLLKKFPIEFKKILPNLDNILREITLSSL